MVIGIEVIVLWPNTSDAVVLACPLGSCPKEVRLVNNGQRLTYRVGRKFSLVLDKHLYDVADARCEMTEFGSDVAQETITFDYTYPYRAKRFEVINPGECLLQVGDFSVTVVVVE